MEKRANIFSGFVLTLISLFLITMYATDVKNGIEFRITDIVVFLLLAVSWLQFLTWGKDKKMQQDELGKMIAFNSAKYSYFIVTGCLFVLWLAERITSNNSNAFGNTTLLIAICIAVLAYPTLQLLFSRKYK